MLEGPHAVSAALDAGATVDEVFFEAGADEALLVRSRAAGAHVAELAPGSLARVSDAVSPQPVMGVAPMCDVGLSTLIDGARRAASRPLVVLHGVGDPGNVGALLRSAEASGAVGVIVSGQGVDVFNPKCVRASAGAIFHIPIAVGGDGVAVMAELQAAERRCIATDASAALAYDTINLAHGVAIFLGNEAGGLPPDVVGAADEVVSVPIEGRSESLNVAAAGAVICFEAARQRRRA